MTEGLALKMASLSEVDNQHMQHFAKVITQNACLDTFVSLCTSKTDGYYFTFSNRFRDTLVRNT